ncbi:MAG TPA: hypothetical protein VFU86_22735 [Terriglobales bacterium]|nr:hypothetical protein [Terriglobales bacterium]
MPRIVGLEKKEAPLSLRWFYGVMRKMFGKDLTPAKVQMKYPPMVWGANLMDLILGRRRTVSMRLSQLGRIRAALRVGCPF